MCNKLFIVFLGKPILAAFSNEHLLLLATIIYLLTFFCPGDLGYKFVKLVPVYAAVCTIKEIYRALKISKGLKEGAAFKSDSFFIPVLIATIKVIDIHFNYHNKSSFRF